MTDLLRQAAEWRLLGLLFECPRPGWRDDVAALAAEVDCAGLREAARHAHEEASEGLYHSTFGPGGPASPREVTYKESVELGHLMSELVGYYEAFAYHPTTEEPPDHVAVEAGFVAYLRLKEAYAQSSGDAEHAAITAEAAREFLTGHLSVMATPLAAALQNSPAHYLALAGEQLQKRG